MSDRIVSHPSNDKYREGWERAFGKKNEAAAQLESLPSGWRKRDLTLWPVPGITARTAKPPSQPPLDDLELPDECECEFMPYDDGDTKPSVHFKRRCSACGSIFWSLHCPHEGARHCGCKTRSTL